MNKAAKKPVSQDAAIDVEKAEALLLRNVKPINTETISLELASGRVLQEKILADRDQPAFDRVTMDGVAINHSAINKGTTKFFLQDKQLPGQEPKILSDEHYAIAIMTGAPLPKGCTAVIPKENLLFHGQSVFVHAPSQVREHDNVHRSGSDFGQNELLLTPGSTINVGEAGAIASTGRSLVTVSSMVRIAIVVTGNEIDLQGGITSPFHIRDVNGPILTSLLASIQGCEVDRVYAPDEIDELEKIIGNHLATHDVVITTGGVSKGDADFVPHVMQRLRVKKLFHGVAQKPGKPLWAGLGPRGLVFGLPGNPVSVTHCFVRYVLPAIRLMQQATLQPLEYVRLGGELRGLDNKTCFVPAAISSDENAVLWAQPNNSNTSGDFSSLIGADGFIELPRGSTRVTSGTPVRLFRFRSLK